MRSLGAALFPLALVALLAMLSFWLQRAANPDDPARKAQKRHDPDYIIENIDVRHFDSTGSLKQSLLAATLTHFPDDDSTEIAAPEMTYFAGESHRKLLANTAQISHDNKQVLLRGDVRLIKPPDADRAATIMRTEALTVFPDDDVAQGNSRVTISQGESIVSGDSIRFDGRNNVTILAGRVKGTFYRAKKS